MVLVKFHRDLTRPIGTQNVAFWEGKWDPLFQGNLAVPSGKTNMAGKWTRIEDVFPIENDDIPASYVSLVEANPT